jgi:hypothetical protein
MKNDATTQRRTDNKGVGEGSYREVLLRLKLVFQILQLAVSLLLLPEREQRHPTH